MMQEQLHVRLRILKRRDNGEMINDEITLHHGPGLYEWCCLYHEQPLIQARIKKSRRLFYKSDIKVNYPLLRSEHITLYQDEKLIAQSLNDIVTRHL